MSSVKELKKLTIYIASRGLCRALEALAFLLSLLFNQPKRALIPPISERTLVTSALKLSEQIKSGSLSSEQVVAAFIKRIKLVNPHVNAVVDERFEEALEEARKLDARLASSRAPGASGADRALLELPLVGVPVSIKETIAVQGRPHTGGLRGRRLVRAQANAPAVDRLLAAGLVPVALTNIPELAMWWDSSNPVYGTTNNPYDLARISGGSSGGEAALIAAAGSLVGCGSDIAGSLRIPANFCGVYAHKPTPKVVPTEGMFPFCHGEREMLLGLGPLTRYACDLLPMLRALAGPEGSAKLRLDEPVDLSKVKLFYIEQLNDPLASACNKDIVEGLHRALSYLQDTLKVPVEQVSFEEFKFGFLLWSAEAAKEPNLPNMAQQFKEGSGSAGPMRPLCELGRKLLGLSEHNFNSIVAVALEKFGPAHGTRANSMLQSKAAELRKKFNALLGDSGLLLVPTHPEPAPQHHLTALKVLNVTYTSATTVLQAPITQVPLGLTREGLPYGVQVFARPHNDRLTLALARELEHFTGGWTAPCRVDL